MHREKTAERYVLVTTKAGLKLKQTEKHRTGTLFTKGKGRQLELLNPQITPQVHKAFLATHIGRMIDSIW